MKVSIEKESDGTYIAYNTTGDKVTLIGTGDTVEEAKEDFYNSIEEVKEAYESKGYKVPDCLIEDVDFYLNL
ncbi:MAG: hypothetical protein ACI30S_06200 [Muribaculaceae bacterium]